MLAVFRDSIQPDFEPLARMIPRFRASPNAFSAPSPSKRADSTFVSSAGGFSSGPHEWSNGPTGMPFPEILIIGCRNVVGDECFWGSGSAASPAGERMPNALPQLGLANISTSSRRSPIRAPTVQRRQYWSSSPRPIILAALRFSGQRYLRPAPTVRSNRWWNRKSHPASAGSSPESHGPAGVIDRESDLSRRVRPPARNELEISDVNNECIRHAPMTADRVHGWWAAGGENIDKLQLSPEGGPKSSAALAHRSTAPRSGMGKHHLSPSLTRWGPRGPLKMFRKDAQRRGADYLSELDGLRAMAIIRVRGPVYSFAVRINLHEFGH